MTGRKRECTVEGCTSSTVARRLCKNHYQAAWASGELGAHPTVPKRPRLRDRKVCPPEHKHDGSSTCYIQHQCRCDPCTDLHTEMSRSREKLKAYGRFETDLVDLGPAREHLLMLCEFGYGYKRVAELAGIGITPVRTLIWGRQDPGPRYGEMQKRVKRATAEAILRVKPSVELLADGMPVPARGAQRRVQALVARGWSQSKIATRLGIDPTNFATLMQRDRVLAGTYRAVSELYEELWDQAPPEDAHRDKIAASRARRYALERGWVPPLAWDDIDSDPAPPEIPDEERLHWNDVVDHAAVELAVTGSKVRLSPASRRAAVEVLHGMRWSQPRIAEQLHCATKTIERIYDELGLAAWTKSEISEDGRRAAA